MESLRLFPRPTLAIVADGRCRCFCHSVSPAAATGDEYAEHEAPVARINGIGNRSVPTDDVTDAALACPVCRDSHTPALAGRPPELDLPLHGHRYNPKPLEAAPQADGADHGF